MQVTVPDEASQDHFFVKSVRGLEAGAFQSLMNTGPYLVQWKLINAKSKCLHSVYPTSLVTRSPRPSLYLHCGSDQIPVT